MKNIFVIICAFMAISLFSANSLSSAELSIIDNYHSNIIKNSKGQVQKYSVLVSSTANPRNNSDFKEYYINRVPDKFYQKGIIQIKTKFKTDDGKSNLLQAANSLNSQLSSIGATNIETLADYNEITKFPEMKKYGLDRIYTINIPKDKDPLEVCAELMKNPDVEYATPVYVRFSTKHVPNDPMITQQYALESMKLYDAWEVTKGSSDVTIAIIDSGTDYNHEDLMNNIWKNPNETQANGIDDDKNGKIDDVIGWDFVGNISTDDLYSGNFYEDNDPINITNTHGTSTAGCAAAVTNNSKGIAGAGYNCKIVPIKVGTELANVDGLYQTYKAIMYAANLGVDVINCSWGGSGYSPADQNIVDYAINEKGCFFVAAAGNETNPNDDNSYYPCNYPGVFSVGAYGPNYAIANFTNYGYSVASFAPGVSVRTLNALNKYTNIQGTSFSSPYMAGIAALIKSIHPDWTPKKIWHQLRSTSDRVLKLNNSLDDRFFGSVNAYKAVTYNSTNSNLVVPGIGVENYSLDGIETQKQVINYEKHIVNIKLKNHLGDAKNLKIRIGSPDEFVDCDTSFTVGNLNANNELNLNINFSLNDKNPWSNGTAKFVVYYTADNYNDYEMIPIPINVPTNVNTAFSGQSLASFITSSSPNIDDAFALGTFESLPGYSFAFLLDISSRSVKTIKPYLEYATSAICGVNKDLAYMAAYRKSSNFAAILTLQRSSNSDIYGHTTYNVSNITSFVNDIYFKQNGEVGIFLGDAKSGTWGIGYTSNSGATWNLIPNPISAQTNETGLVGASDFDGQNNVWFGSSNGKVYHSSDFGQNWNFTQASQNQIVKVAFIDNNNGMAMYSTTAGVRGLVSTTDGGQTWTVVKDNLINIGLNPIKIFADSKVNSYVIVNYDGALYQSYNNGFSWKPILKSYNYNVTAASAGFAEDKTVSVSLFGSNVENVRYKSVSADAKPNLAFVDANPFSYDSVQVNEFKIGRIQVANDGDADATITNAKIEVIKGTAEEFVLISNFNSLKAGADIKYIVKFAPLSEGEKEAKLILNYNDKTIETRLIGYAFSPANDGLTILSGSTIEIDTVALHTTKTKVIVLKNSSPIEFTISSINKSGNSDPDNELSIITTFPATIKPNEEFEVIAQFTGKVIGTKSGTLEINNSSPVNPIKVNYTATVYDNSNVAEDNFINKIIPNPAQNHITITSNDAKDYITAIEIYGQQGNLALKYPISNPENNISLDISSLSQGTYNVILIKRNSIENLKLVIVK